MSFISTTGIFCSGKLAKDSKKAHAFETSSNLLGILMISRNLLETIMTLVGPRSISLRNNHINSA